MAKLTVIVPVYNAEKYIATAVNSIINQSFKDIKIILVDDGSIDKSGSICDAFSSAHDNITVIHQENSGPAKARNAGLFIANTPLVAFMDSDDIIDKDIYTTLITTLENDNLDVVYCTCFRFFNDDLDNISVRHITPVYCKTSSEIAHELMLPLVANINPAVEVSASSCMAIYKTDIIKKNNIIFKDMQVIFSEDNFFNLEYLSKASSAAALDIPLYFYRKSDNSASTTLHGYALSASKAFVLEAEKLCLSAGLDKDTVAEMVRLRYMTTLSTFIKKKADITSLSQTKIYINNALTDDFVCDAVRTVSLKFMSFQVKLFTILLRYRLFSFLYILIKIYSHFIIK